MLTYQAFYEGDPITDDVILDAQQLLEDLSQLEADSVAHDFLRLELNTSSNFDAFKLKTPNENFSHLSIDVKTNCCSSNQGNNTSHFMEFKQESKVLILKVSNTCLF